MKTNKETKDLISEWKKTRLFFGICLLLLLFATPVMLPTVSHADFEQFGQVYEVLEEGTMYKSDDCFIYIPNDCSEKTVCDVYFAGGCGGWVLRQDLAVNYLKNYKPDGIFIWYKNSGIYDRVNRVSRTADLLNQLHSATGVDTGTVSITSSSNGGYTALKAIAYLYEHHQIQTETLLVLDMGMNFLVAHLLPSEEECKIISQVGTEIYFFDQRCIDRRNPQLTLLESFGLQYHLIYCTKDEHIQISRDGFTEGAISWALGEQEELRPDYYEFA